VRRKKREGIQQHEIVLPPHYSLFVKIHDRTGRKRGHADKRKKKGKGEGRVLLSFVRLFRVLRDRRGEEKGERRRGGYAKGLSLLLGADLERRERGEGKWKKSIRRYPFLFCCCAVIHSARGKEKGEKGGDGDFYTLSPLAAAGERKVPSSLKICSRGRHVTKGGKERKKRRGFTVLFTYLCGASME